MPYWVPYMAASCFAAFLVGAIVAHVMNEWDKR